MRQEFRWKHKLFDITSLLEDLEVGRLRPQQIELSHAFIEGYESMFLNPENGLSRPPLAVNSEYAAKVPPEHLGVPIVILYVGLNEGLISLCEDEPEPHYVVADGNHRLLAARRLRIPLNAYVLSPIESEVYSREINS